MAMTDKQNAIWNMHMNKNYRYDGEILPLYSILTKLKVTRKKITNGMIDYNRRHFNRLDYAGQKAYMLKLENRRYYVAENENGVGISIPRDVFKLMELPFSPDSFTQFNAKP